MNHFNKPCLWILVIKQYLHSTKLQFLTALVFSFTSLFYDKVSHRSKLTIYFLLKTEMIIVHFVLVIAMKR